LTAVNVETGEEPVRAQIAAQRAVLEDLLGREPAYRGLSGHPGSEIPRVAAELGAGLVVLGSRGLGGAPALGSVSERVAQHSPCSVLVVRPQS
jgi:nucleotide-binding universal stress UspA family protein